MTPFLGRTNFDVNTNTYTFSDGSGAIPEEMKFDLELEFEDRNEMGCNGVSVLFCLFSWKDRSAKQRNKP
jgi:hypothetical protein